MPCSKGSTQAATSVIAHIGRPKRGPARCVTPVHALSDRPTRIWACTAADTGAGGGGLRCEATGSVCHADACTICAVGGTLWARSRCRLHLTASSDA